MSRICTLSPQKTHSPSTFKRQKRNIILVKTIGRVISRKADMKIIMKAGWQIIHLMKITKNQILKTPKNLYLKPTRKVPNCLSKTSNPNLNQSAKNLIPTSSRLQSQLKSPISNRNKRVLQKRTFLQSHQEQLSSM